MNAYYVESWGYWFATLARNKRHAYREGVNEFGRGGVKSVRRATPQEVAYYASVRGGARSLEPST